MDKGNIIFLNGVSSSGKSTLAKEIINTLTEYYHISIDNFDIFINTMEDREGNRLIPVETEYFFHRTIAMFSDRGINLIVDHILHDNHTREDCIKVLSNYPVLFVGVHCPLNELEKREKNRGNRNIGQAKQQLNFVHKKEIYNVEVNTYYENIKSCAKKVILELKHSKNHMDGFNKMNIK